MFLLGCINVPLATAIQDTFGKPYHNVPGRLPRNVHVTLEFLGPEMFGDPSDA